MRSSSGMKLESTLSSVVFPVPVPPLTTMLRRPRTHWLMKCATCGVNEPKLMRSSTLYGSFANFRMVMNGPPMDERVHDDVHTGAVGQTGVDHRVRLVDAPADLAHDLVDDAAEVRLVDELHVGERELAAALDVDVVGAVHHDFGDGVVAEQLVDRPVAEHVVGHRLHEHLALGDGEREALLRERPVQLLVDLAPQLGLGHALVGEERAQLVDHELVHLLAHLFELRARAGSTPCAARCSCQRAAGLLGLRHGLPSSAVHRLPRRGPSSPAPPSGPSSDSAMQSSARETGDFGSSTTTGTPGVHRDRHREVVGDREVRAAGRARARSP